MNTTTKNTAKATDFHRASRRTRVVAAALIFAGITGGSLALAGGSAGATTTLAPHMLAAAAAPVTVINAVEQKDAAIAAMQLFDDATNKSFTATTDPTYNTTGWAVAPGGMAEENDAKAGAAPEPETYTVTNATNSSWSLGGSIGVKMGGGIGFAEASVSLKLSASHTWGTSTADTVEIDAAVDPGQMVWVQESQTNATYTGTYSFTANGINYEVTNVTITTPISADGNPLTAVNYRIVQAPIVQAAKHLGQSLKTFDAHRLTAAQLTDLGNKLGLNK